MELINKNELILRGHMFSSISSVNPFGRQSAPVEETLPIDMVQPSAPLLEEIEATVTVQKQANF